MPLPIALFRADRGGDPALLVEALQRRGWMHCETGNERWGDQDIYSREGVPVRAWMDLSYYGKRRVRIMPLWKDAERSCKPYH